MNERKVKRSAIGAVSLSSPCTASCAAGCAARADGQCNESCDAFCARAEQREQQSALQNSIHECLPEFHRKPVQAGSVGSLRHNWHCVKLSGLTLFEFMFIIKLLRQVSDLLQIFSTIVRKK